MKIPKNENGGVLVTVLAMLVVMAAVSGSILSIVAQEYVLSKRTLAWNQALYAAETGVEFSWNELNKLTSINTNGTFMGGTNWTDLGTNTWQYANGTLAPLAGIESSSTFTVTANTNAWIIRSTGTASSPLIAQNVSRTIQVVVNPTTPFEWAILGRGTIDFNGTNPVVDSWNSSDGAYNATPGPGYTRRSNGCVGTNGLLIDAAGSEIYGSMMTGPGGVVTTAPGFNMYSDTTTRNGTNSITDGLEVFIPSVAEPWAWGTQTAVTPASPELAAISGAVQYEMHSAAHADLAFTGSGTVTLYLDSFSQQGNEGLTITPSPAGSSLQVIIYVKDSIDLAGNGGVNETGKAADLQIYGLPTCTSVKIGGNRESRAAIYAPDAAVTVQGTADVYGSFVGNTFQIGGTPSIHYDEALDTVGNIIGFALVAYREE